MEQLAAIRAEAHKAFLYKRTSVKSDKALPRSHIPGLREAILLHRFMFAAARASIRNARAIRRPSKLGSAAPRVGLIWTARAEAIERLLLKRAQCKRIQIHNAPSADASDEVVCTMPRDLVAIRAKRYATRKVRITPAIAPLPDTSETAEPIAIIVAESMDTYGTRGYAQHVARCMARQGLSSKRRVYAALDTAASVRAIYAGLPDELYRRRTGRRYGRWRRTVGATGPLEKAEAEMARRRGHDRLRTSSAPDSPTTFEFDGGAEYAFSTRITAAPRLQAAMMAKYNSPAPRPLVQVDARARAVAFAEQRPMFHTRVMDRFR